MGWIALVLLVNTLSNSSGVVVLQEAKSGRTVLHLAIEQRQESVLRLLLEGGLQLQLQLNATTYAGLTAYQLASCVDATLADRLARGGAQPKAFPDEDSSSEEEDDDEELGEVRADVC